jgi:hypothetical protein
MYASLNVAFFNYTFYKLNLFFHQSVYDLNSPMFDLLIHPTKEAGSLRAC